MIFGKRLLCRVGEVICSPELPRGGSSATFAIDALNLIDCQTLEISIQHREMTGDPWTELHQFASILDAGSAARHDMVTRKLYRLTCQATGQSPHGHVEFVIAPPEWKTAQEREESR